MQLLRKIFSVTYRPFIEKKINRTSFYTWRNIRLKIPGGVFHPKYFFSTKYLLEYVLQLEIKDKNFLELGAGNGLISIACAKAGADVTASDISKKAIAGLKENAQTNNVHIHIIESDLFDSFPASQFDIIAINPPYYPKDARNDAEKAWFCGSKFEYFEKLFTQLKTYIYKDSIVLMILSEDCNLEAVFSTAQKNNFTFKEVTRKKMFWEWNYIFEIHYDAA